MSLLSGLVPNWLGIAFKQVARSNAGRIVLGINEDSISDERFCDQLSQVRELKRFLFQETLRLNRRICRKWHLPSWSRSRFIGTAGHQPNLNGDCSTGTTMISETGRMNGLSQVTQGSVESGETDFDLTDRNLIGTRIITGILFAFLLGIPLSAGSLKFVVSQIASGDITTVEVDGTLAMTIALNTAAVRHWLQHHARAWRNGPIRSRNPQGLWNDRQVAWRR